MDEKDFALRLARLREKKGVSAREMSLAIGQNAGYINNIESGKSLPSLPGVFYICEYLQISPSEFFDLESTNPSKLDTIIKDMKRLDDSQLETIAKLVRDLTKSRYN
ncbi:MAG: helix-turn-helix domain-containing protein [Monoglobaceae bacterium]